MINPEPTADEAQEDAVPLHSTDHRNSVRTYDDRMHFEFVSNDNSNINLVMNNHNKNSSITTPSISQGARSLQQTEDDEEVEVLYNKKNNATEVTNNDMEVRNDKGVITYIRKDYLPRDKITDSHILSIIGTSYKHAKDRIKNERHLCQSMKSDFLCFARKRILNGYFEAANTMRWNVGGQPITAMKDLKSYIASQKWNEQLQKQLHYLHYKRFKIDQNLYRWDHILSDEYCNTNNIRYLPDHELSLLINGKTRVKKMRPCFPILAVSTKSDINKKIREMCLESHNACVKERAENTNKLGANLQKKTRRTHYNWDDGYNHEVERNNEKDTQIDSSEMSTLKEKLKYMEGEVVKLRQSRADSFADFVFEDNIDTNMVRFIMIQLDYKILLLSSHNVPIYLLNTGQ